MNYTLIILGIILILVLYVLYRFVYDRQTMVSKKQYLADTVGDKKMGDIANAESARYSYNLWIYANTISGTEKIFAIDQTKFKLEITNTGNLQFDISGNTNNVTSNYPLQKWVCVSISVDNNIVDSYLDGKLVKSQKIGEISVNKPTKTSKISMGKGDKTGDIYIAEFERLPYPIDPQTAWDRYMAGNGGSYISNAFAAYGANLILTKDQVDMKKYALF
jgi:hypothetical protein